tara:strand:- start:16435 stop:16992 length:558 start_codon:yes stop_codon:yes gene_type:complete
LSSNKSFSTETSERYALALFELSRENSELEIVEKNVSDFLELYRSSKDLENFVKNPTQLHANQIRVIKEISKIMKFSQTLEKFLSILVVKRRIFYIKEIFLRFLILSSKKRGELTATLTSSKKLTSEEISSLNNELSHTIGSKIIFNNMVDESLLGGLKVQIGSLMIDTSIKNKLKKIEKLMLES